MREGKRDQKEEVSEMIGYNELLMKEKVWKDSVTYEF
jgi:hypothetical protein